MWAFSGLGHGAHDFFAEHRRSTHSKKTPAEAGAKLRQIV